VCICDDVGIKQQLKTIFHKCPSASLHQNPVPEVTEARDILTLMKKIIADKITET